MRTAVKRYINFQLQPYTSAAEGLYRDSDAKLTELQPYTSAAKLEEKEFPIGADKLQPYTSAGNKEITVEDVEQLGCNPIEVRDYIQGAISLEITAAVTL